ncbi:helix-turn-helix domain-containing protein [Streptomyces monticola]|uniref:Helix-turn-helix domain-containing protein n=1 Tax=Streptomyces monticola TaxID=2666263 RepID=A0ABW2JCX7_9ACTN
MAETGMDSESVSGSLADRLNHLFEVIHPAGRRPYSNEEVATLLQEQGGPTVSGTYLWQLRTGRRDNPTKRHLEALADFFGVPVAYFFDDDVARRVGTELDTLRRLREAGVQHIALRAVGLSPKSMNAVLGMIDRVRELEGLPPTAQGPNSAPQGPAAQGPDAEVPAAQEAPEGGR